MTWVNNSNLDGVVSFIRKKGNEEILVLVNLTNRITKIQVDVPCGELRRGPGPAEEPRPARVTLRG